MQPTKNLQTKIIKTCIMKWTGLRKSDTGQLLPRSFWELLSISQALPGTISSSKEYLRNCKLNTLRKSFWCLLKTHKTIYSKKFLHRQIQVSCGDKLLKSERKLHVGNQLQWRGYPSWALLSWVWTQSHQCQTSSCGRCQFAFKLSIQKSEDLEMPHKTKIYNIHHAEALKA